MENVIEKIKRTRNSKGFSHEYMAQELEMSTSAYTKLERLDTKLTVERLYKIAEILETPVIQFLNDKNSNIYHQNFNDSSINYQEIQNLFQENKETLQKLLDSKDHLINKQQGEIDFLRDLLNK